MGVKFAPDWVNVVGEATFREQILEGETVFDAFRRVATAAADRLSGLGLAPGLCDDLEHDFITALDKGWLSPATPVLANMGTDRAFPISCFGIDVDDSLWDIGQKRVEMEMLTQKGGGVGVGMNRLRPKFAPVSSGGHSNGVVPWIKTYDSAIIATSQAGVRRGSCSINLSIRHKDIKDFLKVRIPEGDVNRQSLNVNHCVQITDEFMESIQAGNAEDRELWETICDMRFRSGQPYLHFLDTTNRGNPEAYKRKGLLNTMTNICTEIVLYTDPEHSFVCCLSSLNLAKYDEWKGWTGKSGLSMVELITYFLEGVMEDFIVRSEGAPGFENSRRSAVKGRAIGIGVLGWHTLLQKRNLPFVSMLSTSLTHQIFKKIRDESEKASRDLADLLGEPEWCEGTGLRHTHRMAIAPTVSNAKRANASDGIEPYAANYFMYNGAQGSFVIKNQQLEKVLEAYGKNDDDTWRSIANNEGSVQHLGFLTADEKEVYLTFREISQLEIVRQAGVRQQYVDQAQSINLAFSADVDERYFHKVHVEAWKVGLKTLYYCRSKGVLKGDVATRVSDMISKELSNDKTDCTFCEG
jgi:ribonucleoside-diphosphate reductase alpha chain